MKIDRMELDDCGSPEKLLVAIFTQVPEFPIPVPIEEFAAQVGITDINEVETEGFEGGLITNASKSHGAIIVNKRSPKFRRRFTIGHECGHLLVPAHKPAASEGFRCTAKDFSRMKAAPTDRAALMEVEANRFSAGILMPARQFRKDIERLRGVDIEHVLQLAERYQTSKDATARNYVAHNDEPCAAIVAQNGKILRIYRGLQFPFIEPAVGQGVPAFSRTAKYDDAAKKMSGWQEIDKSVWLSDAGGRGRDAMYEQVLLQANGFRLTLLSIDPVEEDEEAEEQEIERSWKVGFRR